MNTHELTLSLGKIYQCVDGPPTAYFELPIPKEMVTSDHHPVLRVIYSTIRVAMIGEIDRVEPILTAWVYEKLAALITPEERNDHWRVLFWRMRPVLFEFPDAQGRSCIGLRMRLAIPGADLSELEVKELEQPTWL